jgi:hypothetical protein
MKKNKMLDLIVEDFVDEEILKMDGLDDAIIGIEQKTYRLIYSVTKIIEILCQDMSDEDAWDYFGYNIECAYVGEKTPILCYDNYEL